jgi:hypothetical protein
MGEWLRSIKAALPSIDHDHFDAIVDLAFGPFSEVATSPPRLDAAVQSVRDLVLTDPGLAALPMSMAIERWSTEISEPNRALRRAALGFLQKAASYNSSAHLQFNYVAGSKHKMLKDAFAKGNPDPKQIKALASDLLNFLRRWTPRLSTACHSIPNSIRVAFAWRALIRVSRTHWKEPLSRYVHSIMWWVPATFIGRTSD